MSKNTRKNLTLRFFLYYDKKDKEFVGVCVNLGIIKTGNDPNRVKADLENAAMGYVETVVEKKLPDYLLHQKPPKQYLDIFNKIRSALQRPVVNEPKFEISEAQVFVKPVRELCPAF